MVAPIAFYSTSQVARALGWEEKDLRARAERGEVPCDIDSSGRRKLFHFPAPQWNRILAALTSGTTWPEINQRREDGQSWPVLLDAIAGSDTASSSAPVVIDRFESLEVQLALANGRVADLERRLGEEATQLATAVAEYAALDREVVRLRAAVAALVSSS